MPKKVPAVTVRQWLPAWDKADFSEAHFRRRPPEQFLLLSIDASELRRLVGIQRRSTASGRARSRDLGIQRAHDELRSREIREYVRHGFPWSSLSKNQRLKSEFQDLVKPGWLPTAVVVNILTQEDERDGGSVSSADRIDVEIQDDGTAVVHMPDTTVSSWALSGPAPLEVIDGQHRLWAFDEDVPGYQIPVVAFHGLDRSWQAYLFYTINIKPKRINTSLAFDLYPLLRTEDWLEKFEGHSIYRETRAQELTEALWSHPSSPWRGRINMLGERGTKSVTQASWVRSLQATIVKSFEGRRVQIGGLFGAPVGDHRLVLPWSRAQQAAFLIYAWRELEASIMQSDADWIAGLRQRSVDLNPAFAGPDTLLNSDMGVRGFLYVLNDLCFVRASNLSLFDWETEDGAATSEVAVSDALASLADTEVANFVVALVDELAVYDWRSSKADGLSERDRQAKARFRGGSGYRELRIELLAHLRSGSNRTVVSAAQEVAEKLGYDR